MEGHETPNPEAEIWKFLVLISKNETDITKKQYTEKVESKEFNLEGKKYKLPILIKNGYGSECVLLFLNGNSGKVPTIMNRASLTAR